MELIEKLISIIPKPRIHLIRFHGSLAPNSKIRKQVVPERKNDIYEEKDESCLPHPNQRGSQKRVRLKWSDLLKKVFQLDLDECPKCGGKMRFISVICDKEVIRKILAHLNWEPDPPILSPAKLFYQEEFSF